MSDKLEMDADLVKELKGLPELHKSAIEAAKNGDAELEKKLTDKLLEFEGKSTDFANKVKALEDFKAEAEKEAETKGQTVKDLESRIKDFEIELATKGNSSDGDDVEAYWSGEVGKAFYEGAKSGNFSDFETKAATDYQIAEVDHSGVLLPQIMDNEIRKQLVEISPMRRHARVTNITSMKIDLPKRSGTPVASRKGEAVAADPTSSTYGIDTVTLDAMTALVGMTKDLMLASTPFDLQLEMRTDMQEQFARREGIEFISGNGALEAEGLMVAAGVQSVESAAVGALSFADLAKLTGELKSGYDPMFGFNRKTLAQLMVLEGSDGHPIWTPTSADGSPPAIWGFRYDAGFIDMDDPTGAGSQPIVFGDFRRGYRIFDRSGIEVIRDEFTRKAERVVEFSFDRYTTGKVVQDEAFVKLTLKAA